MKNSTTALLLDLDIKKVNVIVLDIDGTVLKSNNMIQTGLDKICNILNANGIEIILASARPIISILDIARILNIQNPVIGLNGSIIADSKKILYETYFHTAKILEILLRFQNISLNYYINYEWIVNKKDERILSEEKLVSMKASVKDIPISKTQKILIIGDQPILENIKSDLSKIDEIECNFSKLNYLEINPKGMNKVSAIHQYLNMMNIISPIVMAIGDGENDLSMIKEFEVGVAMGNAPKIVKNAADYILDTNDNNGLVNFLNSFCIARGFQS